MMKKHYFLIILTLIVLIACSNPKVNKDRMLEINTNSQVKGEDADKIDSKWVGHYSCLINYGEIDANSGAVVGYDLEISEDKIIFSGMGYQTNFTDQCMAKEINDTLLIYYQQTLEGTDYNKNENPVLKLYVKDGKHFVKSSVIWVGTESNIEVEVEKTM